MEIREDQHDQQRDPDQQQPSSEQQPQVSLSASASEEHPEDTDWERFAG